jgi:hypothetical protein
VSPSNFASNSTFCVNVARLVNSSRRLETFSNHPHEVSLICSIVFAECANRLSLNPPPHGLNPETVQRPEVVGALDSVLFFPQGGRRPSSGPALKSVVTTFSGIWRLWMAGPASLPSFRNAQRKHTISSPESLCAEALVKCVTHQKRVALVKPSRHCP